MRCVLSHADNTTWFELGNEQYNPHFAEQVAAMEARATKIGMPPNPPNYNVAWCAVVRPADNRSP